MSGIPILPNAVRIDCNYPPLSNLNLVQIQYIQPMFIRNTTYYQGMHDEYVCQLVTASPSESITLTKTLRIMLPRLKNHIYPTENGQFIYNNG